MEGKIPEHGITEGGDEDDDDDDENRREERIVITALTIANLSMPFQTRYGFCSFLSVAIIFSSLSYFGSPLLFSSLSCFFSSSVSSYILHQERASCTIERRVGKYECIYKE